MTTIIFIRHAQSQGNLLEVYNGQRDYPLTPHGVRQAECTARYLQEHYSIDAIYASDLSRTCQTAQPLAEALGITTVPVKELRELDVGVWEGRSPEELMRSDEAELYERWKKGEDVAPRGGESVQQVRARVCRFLDRVIQKHKGECVALYTHWGPIYQVFQKWLEQKPETSLHTCETVRIQNASVTVGLLDDDGTFLRFAECSHVDHLRDLISNTKKGLI